MMAPFPGFHGSLMLLSYSTLCHTLYGTSAYRCHLSPRWKALLGWGWIFVHLCDFQVGREGSPGLDDRQTCVYSPWAEFWGLKLAGRILRSFRQRVVNWDRGPMRGRQRSGDPPALGVNCLDQGLGRSGEVSDGGVREIRSSDS